MTKLHCVILFSDKYCTFNQANATKRGVNTYKTKGEVVVENSTISRLLELIGKVTIPATGVPFIARESFVVGTSPDAPVKISFIGTNFTAWFGAKTEGPHAQTDIYYFQLLEFSVGGLIIAELGGEEKAETKLVEIYALIENQRNGEQGILLTNSDANVFVVHDVNGVLRVVNVRWDYGGWRLSAYSVEVSYGWGAGGQVFSRNSLLL